MQPSPESMAVSTTASSWWFWPGQRGSLLVIKMTGLYIRHTLPCLGEKAWSGEHKSGGTAHHAMGHAQAWRLTEL